MTSKNDIPEPVLNLPCRVSKKYVSNPRTGSVFDVTAPERDEVFFTEPPILDALSGALYHIPEAICLCGYANKYCYDFLSQPRPGDIKVKAKHDDDNTSAFARNAKTIKPDPKQFLTKGLGTGGHATSELKQTNTDSVSPVKNTLIPKAGAFQKRCNPPNTAFRKFYERGDLPIQIQHTVRTTALMLALHMITFYSICFLDVVGG